MPTTRIQSILTTLTIATLLLTTATTHAQRSSRSRRGDQPASTHPITLVGPDEEQTTSTNAVAHIAARITPGTATSASIAGTTVPIFGTGVFVRDSLPLQMGLNQIAIRVEPTTGPAIERTIEITRTTEQAKATSASLPLAIDPKSIEPAENVALNPGEELQVSFRGAPGNIAECMLPGGIWQLMAEVRETNPTTPGALYRTTLTAAAPAGTDAEASQPITLRLRSSSATSDPTPETIITSKARIQVISPNAPPHLVRVKDDQIGRLAYGLTEVRLGGPYLAELTSGTILRVVGRRGFNLRVQLSPDQHAWIPAYEVEKAPAGTAVPHLDFTDLNTTITATGDEALLIPYGAPIPFVVRDVVSTEKDGNPAVTVDLYGAHNAVTWITHRRPGKVIRQVTVDQIASDHLRVTAHLQGKRIWGYKWEVTTGSLRVTLRKPATLQAGAASPLAGLTVAVEAGHGGSNAGATGITGSREKDVTRAVADNLEQQLTAAGAKVVHTRIGDESAGLSIRAQRAMDANADLFVSIHCNSAGTPRGYLATAGNAMFYKHPFNHDLATAMHQRILEQTELAPYGVVGNFNYAPTRVLTWMPAVLVEQAFISNPKEEAQMIDPAFQTKMAQGIKQGLEDWLKAE